MTFDLRTRHSLDLHHYSKASNGTSIPSNWIPAATGDSGVGWQPQSGGAASFGSNSNSVGSANAPGASTLSSRADHVHQGVHQISSNGSNARFEDVNLAAGTGIALGVSAQTITITNTSGAGGGGGSSITDYVSGASGTGHIIIPGFAGSIDIPAGGGSDDEFDASLSGSWTQFGTNDTCNSNSTRKSHLYLKKNAASGAHVSGVYMTSPSMPFTVTAKLADLGLYGSFNMAGVFVGVANPSSGAFKGMLFQVNGIAGQYNPGVIAWTNPTTYNGGGTYQADYAGILPIYLRIIATSSTNVTFSYSYGGRFYIPVVSANNPGFTIGSVGLFVNPDSASNAAEADFDFIRFT